MKAEYVPRVVAENMPELRTKTVLQLGQVVSFDVKTGLLRIRDCSGVDVSVFMVPNLKIEFPLSKDSWIEVKGEVKGVRAMKGEQIFPLSSSLFENFDKDLYETAILLGNDPHVSPLLAVESLLEHHGPPGSKIELLDKEIKEPDYSNYFIKGLDQSIFDD